MKSRHSIGLPRPRNDLLVRDNRDDTAKAGRRRQPDRARPAVKRSETQISSDALSLTGSTHSSLRTPATSNAPECIEYNGHLLRLEQHRMGWRVTIFPKGSPFALHRSPHTSEANERHIVIEQAKAIVDLENAGKASTKTAPEPAAVVETAKPLRPGRFVRFRRGLGRAWNIAKSIYFAVDKSRRAS